MARLHIFLLPFNVYGHLIPSLDMAKLFVSRGVKTTIITTPAFIETIREQDLEVEIQSIRFPAAEAGLPEGCEGADQITSDDMLFRFAKAISLLQEPVEKLLEKFRPDCIVADMFYPWASESATKFNIPRLAFHGTSFFTSCASRNMRFYKPFEKILTDSDPFVIPDLPHKITMTKAQLSTNDRGEIENEFEKLVEKAVESLQSSYGVIFNSFYELEPEYADYYKRVVGKKAWHIGPLFLSNNKGHRGKRPSIDEHECLKWLDSKKPDSVVYVCFGSIAPLSESQLHEIAFGLEESDKDFIWVVKKENISSKEEKWLPEGFEERMGNKGLIIRGWAPQLLILRHVAIGAFVTHCGWNSVLEALSSGLVMVTWPLFAEQFYNEKLVTEVLKVGISVGNKKWSAQISGKVKREAVVESLRRAMIGEEAVEMRRRVVALKEMAREAVEEGGSSCSDLSSFLDELSEYCSTNKSKYGDI